jgi:hypothetical protein
MPLSLIYANLKMLTIQNNNHLTLSQNDYFCVLTNVFYDTFV